MNWQRPGDFLCPYAESVRTPRKMIQIMEPLPDGMLRAPMRWFSDGEPGPWRWLQPDEEILKQKGLL
jgi:hypothetical protein